METIAVYGSGTIGSCEATLMIGHGLPCVVIGHSESGLERCRRAIEQNWDDLINEGLATERNKEAALKLLTIIPLRVCSPGVRMRPWKKVPSDIR